MHIEKLWAITAADLITLLQHLAPDTRIYSTDGYYGRLEEVDWYLELKEGKWILKSV